MGEGGKGSGGGAASLFSLFYSRGWGRRLLIGITPPPPITNSTPPTQLKGPTAGPDWSEEAGAR